MNTEKFDLWCLVELFGHSKIAGRCTEQNIAGANMLRVDVPETKAQPAFTRFFGASAIYAINPMDEEAVRLYAEKLEITPINSYDISAVMKKYNERSLPVSPSGPSEEDYALMGDVDYDDVDDDPGF